MEKRTLIAVSLSLLVFMGYQQFFIKKTANTVVSNQGYVVTDSKLAQERLPEETRSIQTKQGKVELSGKGDVIKSYSLSAYPISISSVANQEGAVEVLFDEASGLGNLKDAQGVWSQSVESQVWTFEDDRIKWVKQFKKGSGDNSVLFYQSFEFKKNKPNHIFVGVSGKGIADDEEANDRKLVYFSNQSLEGFLLSGEMELKQISTRPDYIGVTNRYFLFSLINRYNGEAKLLTQPNGDKGGKVFMVFPVQGNKLELPLEIYFGPKKLDLVRSVEPKLDHTVDFGWFTFFAYGLLKSLNFLYDFTRNYGISIVLLTLLLKVLTFPLTYKSMKSMKQMQRVQPMIQKLKEKHKDNPQQMNQEMMQLMKTQGYNPVSGCLPILVQMPIFFALYRVLYGSIELYQAPFMFWISDLSLKDPLYITPVILTIVMYFQQKLSPSQVADPMQAKMIQFMPIFFGIFMVTLPSGLTLYMLTNAIAGIAQQVYLNKKLGITPNPGTGVVSA